MLGNEATVRAASTAASRSPSQASTAANKEKATRPGADDGHLVTELQVLLECLAAGGQSGLAPPCEDQCVGPDGRRLHPCAGVCAVGETVEHLEALERAVRKAQDEPSIAVQLVAPSVARGARPDGSVDLQRLVRTLQVGHQVAAPQTGELHEDPLVGSCDLLADGE